MFYDKAQPPTAAELTAALGPTETLWHELRRLVTARHAPIVETWTFSGKTLGWALSLKQKKRAVLYLKPLDQHFRASLALREDAVLAAQGAGLPAAILKVVEDAPRYHEGRGIQLDIRGEDDIGHALTLAGLRMAR